MSKKTVLGSTSFSISDVIANMHQVVGESWPLSNGLFLDLTLVFTPVASHVHLEKSAAQLEPLRVALDRSVYFAGECVSGVAFLGAAKVWCSISILFLCFG